MRTTTSNRLAISFIAAILLAGPADPALAQAAPDDHGTGTEGECATYGCIYTQPPSYHCRRDCPRHHVTSHEQLPEEDGRRFEGVHWPAVTPDYQYDPARRDMWDDVAYCESTWRWDYNGSSGYDGGLQFYPPTWRAYGGGEYASHAYLATPEQQIAVAERVLWAGHGPHRPQGKGAWPHCGRRLTAP